MSLLVFIYLFIRTYINMAGRVCRPCDWWETLFLRSVRYVSWKGEGKKAGVRNEVEKILVLGSVARKTPSASATTETEGETLRSDLSWFYFYCARPREGDDLSIISSRAPSRCGPDITNVTCAAFVFLRFTTRREHWRQYAARYHRRCSDRSHFTLKLWRDRIYLCPSGANVFHGRQKFAEFESFSG